MKQVFKTLAICLLLGVTTTATTEEHRNSSRFQIVTAKQDTSEGALTLIFKIDTWTGKTWVYNHNSHTHYASGTHISVFQEVPDQSWAAQMKSLERQGGGPTSATNNAFLDLFPK